MNREQQGSRNNTKNRRKNGRNANRKKELTTADKNPIQQEQEKEISSAETNNEKDQESVLEQSDNEQQQQNGCANVEQNKTVPMHVEDDEEPMILVKQRNKSKPLDKTSDSPIGKEEHIVPVKPQASVAPVKQNPSVSPMNSPKSAQDNHFKTNGHTSIPHSLYTFSGYNPLPPRFQQQRQQKEAEFTAQKFRRRRGGGGGGSKKASLPLGSAARSNEFVPSSFQHSEQQQQQQQQQQQFEQQVPSPSQLHHVNNERTEVYMCSPEQHQQHQQQELSINNDYSSESEILTDSPINGVHNSSSPIFSASVGSQSSLQRLDLVRSLSTSHDVLDQLISVFDTIPFTSDELDVILSKIASRHISTKTDLQRLLSSTKSDKTFERILDETYRSQAKILAIELQTEKNRVLELTKSNAEMENSIRQIQQQQPTNVVQYQQMILSYQMQLQRLADENNRLQHQLHAYSMFPATINELKQQQHILTEKIRQMTIRNSALENEVADSERASKHAAEIYKKADSQKQERIEQMIADINKYKKLDKELTNLRQKHNELEKNSNTKIDEITEQRDELQKTHDDLKDKIRQYEQIKTKYDQLMKNSSNKAVIKLQEELNDLKTQNDHLRQRNWKIMEELNKLLNEQQQQT